MSCLARRGDSVVTKRRTITKERKVDTCFTSAVYIDGENAKRKRVHVLPFQLFFRNDPYISDGRSGVSDHFVSHINFNYKVSGHFFHVVFCMPLRRAPLPVAFFLCILWYFLRYCYTLLHNLVVHSQCRIKHELF